MRTFNKYDADVDEMFKRIEPNELESEDKWSQLLGKRENLLQMSAS